MQRTHDQHTPLAVALQNRRLEAACCLLSEARLLSAAAKLTAVEQVLPNQPSEEERLKAPLYTLLVERVPLTPEQWGRIPAPCAGLGAALPAVLERSTEEACLLVHRLPPADRARLRTFAVSLARVQQHMPAPLPTPPPSPGACWRCGGRPSYQRYRPASPLIPAIAPASVHAF